MDRYQQTDDGAINKYFSLMLHIDDDDLDPYEYKLLGHYRKVCGLSKTQTCFESNETTAGLAKMSVAKVRAARKTLAKKGCIKVNVFDGRSIHVTLMDRMNENVERYSSDPYQKRNPYQIHDSSPTKNVRAALPKTSPYKEYKNQKKEIQNTLPNPANAVSAGGFETLQDDLFYLVNMATQEIDPKPVLPGDVPTGLIAKDGAELKKLYTHFQVRAFEPPSKVAQKVSPAETPANEIPLQEKSSGQGQEPQTPIVDLQNSPKPLETPISQKLPDAPPKLRWVFPVDGAPAHLVRDANQPTKTVCGLPIMSYGSDGNHTSCVDCLAIIEKQQKPKQPPIYGDLFVLVNKYAFANSGTPLMKKLSGKVAKAVLANIPDITLSEFQRFADQWPAHLTFPQGEDTLPKNIIKWRAEHNGKLHSPAPSVGGTQSVLEEGLPESGHFKPFELMRQRAANSS